MRKTNVKIGDVKDGRQPHWNLGVARVLSGAFLCLVVVVILSNVSGCQKDADDGRKMSQTSGEFTDGYKDGRRDAMRSWTDMHGGWMWLWMTEEQYRRGYDRGWEDGRTEKELRDKQNKQDKERDKATDSLSGG